MTKDIADTAAAKSLSAWVILNKKGVQVGTVVAHFANSGGVTVNVNLWGDSLTRETAEAMGYAFGEDERITTRHGKATPYAGQYAYKVAGQQVGRAGGYGYDKFTAALSGLFIGKHEMSNHCGGRMKRPKGRLWQDSDKARLARKGYVLSNYTGPVVVREGEAPYRYGREDVPDDASGWRDAYRMEGFGYPSAVGGYRFLKAV